MESLSKIAKHAIKKIQQIMVKAYQAVKVLGLKVCPKLKAMACQASHFLLYAYQNAIQGIKGLFGKKNEAKPKSLQDAVKEASVKRPAKTKPIKRLSREKVYRLKGYTTIAKVNRKRKSESRQRLLRKMLLIIIVILVVIVLVKFFNPIDDLTEWYRVIGIDDLSDLVVPQTTSQTETDLTTTVSEVVESLSETTE